MVLGTAQLTQEYGVSYKYSNGPIGDRAAAVLDAASMVGINSYDTAPAYARAEEVLGRCLVGESQVYSKIYWPKNLLDTHLAKFCRNTIRASCENLHRDRLDGVFTHSPNLNEEKQFLIVLETLALLKAEGAIGKIGCSIYEEEELDLISEYFQPDMLQVPANIFDNRFLNSRKLHELHTAGTEVFFRSVFLQGALIVEDTNRLPRYLLKHQQIFQEWIDFARNCNVSQLSACINFVKDHPLCDRLILGVFSPNQVRDLAQAFDSDTGNLQMPKWNSDIPLDLIDPRLWSQ